MKTLGYYNGVIGEIEDLRIPMDDRAHWFGDGVYDTSSAIRHKVLFLEEHIDRFFRSAASLGIKPPLSKEELAGLLADLVRRVDGSWQFVYWQLSRGTAPRAHAFPRAPDTPQGQEIKSNLWVFIRPSAGPDFSKKNSLITVEDTRFFHCNVKTLNLIPNVLASEKARQAGANEAVFYRKNIEGCRNRVTECAHSNIHIIDKGVFRSAPADNLILPGIARAHLLKQCGLLGIPVREEAFTLEELFAAEEIIVSSSSTLCLTVDNIDGKSAGGRAPELLAKLRQAVLDEVEAYIGTG